MLRRSCHAPWGCVSPPVSGGHGYHPRERPDYLGRVFRVFPPSCGTLVGENDQLRSRRSFLGSRGKFPNVGRISGTSRTRYVAGLRQDREGVWNHCEKPKAARNHIRIGEKMDSRSEIEAARLSMMEARRVLEECEAREGFVSSKVHSILRKAFQKATREYLRLSGEQEAKYHRASSGT
jgi:hypothetical protein